MKLNKKDRKCIIKDWEEGSSMKELADYFGVSGSTIKNTIYPPSFWTWRLRPKTKYTCMNCSDTTSKRANIHYPICVGCYEKYLKRPSGTYLEGMDLNREIARMRDKHTCQNIHCGKKWEYGERRFDVHHLKGCGKYSRSYDKNIDNLITLCHKCHLNLDEVREKMSSRTSPRPNKPLPVNLG